MGSARQLIRTAGALAALLMVAGCASNGGGTQRAGDGGAASSAQNEATSTASGRYAMSRDAYPDLPPDVSNVPDAEPRVEPRSRGGNRSTYEVWGKTYQVLSDEVGYSNEGVASWYGEKFHGYATANGEIYDMYMMTAAHRSLPLPSFVKVTSVDNGRSVIVRVNDRGPFHDNREIDLSYAAAARLDILGRGTGRVRVEAIDPVAWQQNRGNGERQVAEVQRQARDGAEQVAAPAAQVSPPREVAASDNGASQAGGVFLQVAALGSASNAEALKSRLQSELNQPVRVASDASVHRVQVGPVSDASRVEPLRDELRRAGFEQTLVIND
ncbi:septal ring lytic transglycosylase RlpA family protein [Franzmannia qiaohouensis]|uniref:Endolytic peptidoglycan transglycosylase RlpA n=1 Tax=Franzmannia qiaohouensis TaxID=1329370 RepID=A0ABU1HJS8_9GAMM|nr:septal ring lytic transglycosylase RlpA family protein [Halomonas qiaohouensis]MDR5907298.1 septal ring lytic transglycosylase RlpA family protein [Halomonas qiaohouensis]